MNCECAICKNNKPFELPKEIIEAVIEGNLVLFCGAGISTEGQTVLPYSFYESIKNDLEIEDDTISFSCLMQQYCDEPNGRKRLLRKIRDRFQYIHSFSELERQATAFHRELAAIYPIELSLQPTGILFLKIIVGRFLLLFRRILLFGMKILDMF